MTRTTEPQCWEKPINSQSATVSKFFPLSAKPFKKKKISFPEVRYLYPVWVYLLWYQQTWAEGPTQELIKWCSRLPLQGSSQKFPSPERRARHSHLSPFFYRKKAESQGNCCSLGKYMLRVKMLRKIIQLAKNTMRAGARAHWLPKSPRPCFPSVSFDHHGKTQTRENSHFFHSLVA